MTTAVCWFRRDLRLHDHLALRAALRQADTVVPLFVLDPALVGARRMSRARLAYLADALVDLDERLRERGAALVVRRGEPAAVVPTVAHAAGAVAVHWHRDHTPYASRRDAAVQRALAAARIEAVPHDGTLLHPPGTVSRGDGEPFKVFTPFARAWRHLPVARPERTPPHVPGSRVTGEQPSLQLVGVGRADRAAAGGETAAHGQLRRFLRSRVQHYAERRDLLAVEGTSGLSAALHFGTLSPRTVWSRVRGFTRHPEFARQLVWRDFYAHVLAAWPEAAHTEWAPAFRQLPWHADGPELDAWYAGETGYPVVDAAMRQLAAHHWIPNRARMIVASFLCKDLLVDWRLGEAHFLRQLVDGDVASNNGGWQWAAGTGTDAQPYFRIFNPVRQGQRFDPDGTYVRRFVPELAAVPARFVHEPWRMPRELQADTGVRIGRDYPHPVIDHALARRRALEWFATHRR